MYVHTHRRGRFTSCGGVSRLVHFLLSSFLRLSRGLAQNSPSRTHRRPSPAGHSWPSVSDRVTSSRFSLPIDRWNYQQIIISTWLWRHGYLFHLIFFFNIRSVGKSTFYPSSHVLVSPPLKVGKKEKKTCRNKPPPVPWLSNCCFLPERNNQPIKERKVSKFFFLSLSRLVAAIRQLTAETRARILGSLFSHHFFFCVSFQCRTRWTLLQGPISSWNLFPNCQYTFVRSHIWGKRSGGNDRTQSLLTLPERRRVCLVTFRSILFCLNWLSSTASES